MCKRIFIFLFLIVGVVAVLTHRAPRVRLAEVLAAPPHVPPPPGHAAPNIPPAPSDVPEIPSPPGYEAPDVAAAMRSLDGKKNSASDSKPWADDFAKFVSDHPDRQWIVGRSTPCLTEAEAAASAHDDAARKIVPRVLRQVAHSDRDVRWLSELVSQDVRTGRLDADRLASRFGRPYGEIWAESILLDVSPQKLQPKVRQYQVHLNEYEIQSKAQQLRFQRRLGLAGIVIFISCLLYVLLNAVTKGYFTFRLRVAAAAIAFAAVLILIV